ncbi:hypothetical protein Ahy_B08g093923 isoform B [Arachis hypogaea]|uniref:DUF7803 domain-containing protein n=1 Tax=Arachis hypogaea TaxID=3818 RepID=A0A444Y7E0_ARAHY|nr:hypothetical protein Ahy_B08g093923 isoform B [Arachis hypogaea]
MVHFCQSLKRPTLRPCKAQPQTQQPSLVHWSFISLAPPRDGNSHSSDDIAPLISNDSLTLSSEEFAFSNTIQPPWMPTMEETILVGDDLMMGPPSPVVPPEIASHVLRGVDLCDGILKNLFLCKLSSLHACKSMTLNHSARMSLLFINNVLKEG